MITETNNIILAETVQEKDLGVWISNNLKWEKQVVAATQKAMVVLRSLKRAILFTLTEKRSTLFIIHILDHI